MADRTHPMMKPMHALYGVQRDGYVGEFQPPVAAIRKPATILHMRQSGDHLLLTISDGGNVQLIRVGKLDVPVLERLSALDRASVQSALVTLQREVCDAAA